MKRCAAGRPGPHVVLGVTGSIAAYRACDIIEGLKTRGCTVTPVLTHEALQFITPLTLEVLAGQPAYVKMFDTREAVGTIPPPGAPATGWRRYGGLPSAAAPGGGTIHIRLAETADVVAVAPATANVIGKIANGIADDLLTCLLLATEAPVVIAPAMNVHMWKHRTVQDNIGRLKHLGYGIVPPAWGKLACGYEGVGHVAAPETIMTAILRHVRRHA